MVKTTELSTKLTIYFEKGSFAYSKIKNGTDSEKVYELADAINSLQDEKAKKIVKTVNTDLVEMII